MLVFFQTLIRAINSDEDVLGWKLELASFWQCSNMVQSRSLALIVQGGPKINDWCHIVFIFCL